MTHDDAPQFFERLAALAEYFDVKQFSDAKSELYFAALSDLPFDAVNRALNEAVRRCKFMPRAAELRDLAAGDDEQQIESAWLTWKTAARRVGGYGSPNFTDGALAQTLVEVFGSWSGACWAEFSAEMWAAKRKEFARVYRTIRARGPNAPTRLIGEIDRDNHERGFDFTGARRVTDADIRQITSGSDDDDSTKH